MNFIKFNKEKTLPSLVKRAYKIEGSGSAEMVRRAEAALLKANPHLANLSAISRGSLIAIPPIAGLTPAERAESPSGEAASEILKQVQTSVEELQKTLLVAAQQTIEEASRSASMAASKDFQVLVRQNAPFGLELLPQTEEGAKKRAESSQKLSDMLEAAFKQVGRDLDDLDKQLR